MKYFSTKKNIVERYGMSRIICVPYADLQNLLRMENPEAYTSGVYGWNADIYGFDGVAICTGYRPFGGVHPSHETIRQYDTAARVLIEAKTANWTPGTYDELRGELGSLLTAFIREVTTR